MKTHIATPASRAIVLSKKAALVALGAAAFSLVSLSASASQQIEPPQQAVNYGDLDLSKQSDTQRLYRRLRMASEQVCGITDRATSRVLVRRECAATALNNAVVAVGHPSLLSLHAAKADVKLAERSMSHTAKS